MGGHFLSVLERTAIGEIGGTHRGRGFIGTIWPVMSQLNIIRTAASCCFTSGAE